jgi:hypothetical protein
VYERIGWTYTVHLPPPQSRVCTTYKCRFQLLCNPDEAVRQHAGYDTKTFASHLPNSRGYSFQFNQGSSADSSNIVNVMRQSLSLLVLWFAFFLSLEETLSLVKLMPARLRFPHAIGARYLSGH